MLINQWHQEPDERFLGRNKPEFVYGFNLSRPTFETGLLFQVGIYHTYTNSINGVVFLSDTVFSFKMQESDTPIDPVHLFPMVDSATFAYAKLFSERTRLTSLRYHQIAKPKLEETLPILKATVDAWEEPMRVFKASGRENLLQFRDLPEIPYAKRFQPGVHHTAEQFISHKLHFNQTVTPEELTTFEGLGRFYHDLDQKLKDLDYASFSVQDELAFKNYILYSFRSTVLLSRDINIDRMYRLVTNADITRTNDAITSVDLLTYPPLEIVRARNVYNRGSTPASTVFYGAQTIDTALKEIKPGIGQRVTIGVWVPIIKRSFIGYPIIHEEATIDANPEIRNARENVREMEAAYQPALLKFIHYYINLLAREYAKPVRDKREYILSALFSEQIFEVNDVNTSFNFDCILYPSVGNAYKTFNFAIKPEVIDKAFKLEKVIQFIIQETFYDREPITGQDTENITLANITEYQVSFDIQNNKINWVS